MPKRDSAPSGAPCWVDVFSSDLDKTQVFYGELFGWTAETAGEEFGGYVNFSKDGTQVAGSSRNDGQAGMPDFWSVYLATPDASATVDAAVTKGGQVFLPPMQVGDLGTMAMLGDTGQAAVGCWQPGTFNGFGMLGEPGTPTWFELHTRDYDAAVEFYRDVFGWDTHVSSDTPEFRYTTLGEGDGQLAGIMDASAFLPEGVPPHWAVYFGTEDTDATLALVAGLGGSVVRPAEDTPYGRIAMASDATGAIFRLVAGS
ncbi:MAG: VOC family protein [Actinomycetota bacterium]|nr:VOC family protein [Actinomycetota bacterium]